MSRRLLATGTVVTMIGVTACVMFLMPATLDNLRYQDFVISGSVVDEQGRQLDGVTVSITTGRAKRMGTTSETNCTFAKVNGSFRFERNNYSIVSLVFAKEGYQQSRPMHWRIGGEHKNIVVTLRRGSGEEPYQGRGLPHPTLGQTR